MSDELSKSNDLDALLSIAKPWLSANGWESNWRCHLSRSLTSAQVCLADWQQQNQSLHECQRDWLLNACDPKFRPFLELSFDVAQSADSLLATARAVRDRQRSIARMYESLLACTDQKTRKQQGVYFTPQAVAEFIVDCVDERLRTAYGLSDGLADCGTWADATEGADLEGKMPEGGKRAFVEILEPALGDGVFLEAIIAKTFQTFANKSAVDEQAWSRFVSQSLLPRTKGLEIDPAALFSAHLNLVGALQKTGFDFAFETNLNMKCVDSLAEFASWHSGNHQTGTMPTVIVGNPPYGALRPVTDEFCRKLLHGEISGPGGSVDYFEADGQPIAERKSWLNDIYVHFMRLSQWRLDVAGAGVMGLITNRGWLDNVTFRGMRSQLAKSFPDIQLVDFGSPRHQSSAAEHNRNLFPISSDVAIGILCKHGHAVSTDHQPQKHTRLGAPVYRPSAAPRAYVFTTVDEAHRREYESGMPLDEVFRRKGSTVITARDWLVIDTSRSALIQRMERFRDLSVPDETIRNELCPQPRTRSQRYLPGNTRSWDLSVARRRLADDQEWQSKIRRCEYRPLDQRFIFWCRAMVDWPRERISALLDGSSNIALIARRQSPPQAAGDFFWAVRQPAVDGILRSDNRGNESVFPLYANDPKTKGLQFNFSDAFAARMAIREPGNGAGRLDFANNAMDWLGFLYAQLFCSEYRARYRTYIATGYPRVFFTSDIELARNLAQRGKSLLALHANRDVALDVQAGHDLHVRRDLKSIATGFRKVDFTGDRVSVDGQLVVDGISQGVWEYRIGAHRPARKFLMDRRTSGLSAGDLGVYQDLLARIQGTQRLQTEIDELIASCGGWVACMLA